MSKFYNNSGSFFDLDNVVQQKRKKEQLKIFNRKRCMTREDKTRGSAFSYHLSFLAKVS